MTHLMVEIVVVWLAAILIGLPLFAAMGLAAFAFVTLGGLSGSIVPQKMAQAMNSFPLVAAPLFILMGNILGAARLTDRTTYPFLGRTRTRPSWARCRRASRTGVLETPNRCASCDSTICSSNPSRVDRMSSLSARYTRSVRD